MFVLCVSAIVLFCFAIVSPSVSGNDIATDRRPVSLEQTDDWLVVANGRAGSIAVVDKRNWSLAMERVLGDKIVDLARMENDFVAVDQT